MVKLTPKAARVLRGVTQAEMADYMGLNRATLSLKENGLSPFKAVEMEKYLTKLQMQDGDVDFVCSNRHEKIDKNGDVHNK